MNQNIKMPWFGKVLGISIIFPIIYTLIEDIARFPKLIANTQLLIENIILQIVVISIFILFCIGIFRGWKAVIIFVAIYAVLMIFSSLITLDLINISILVFHIAILILSFLCINHPYYKSKTKLQNKTINNYQHKEDENVKAYPNKIKRPWQGNVLAISSIIIFAGMHYQLITSLSQMLVNNSFYELLKIIIIVAIVLYIYFIPMIIGFFRGWIISHIMYTLFLIINAYAIWQLYGKLNLGIIILYIFFGYCIKKSLSNPYYKYPNFLRRFFDIFLNE